MAWPAAPARSHRKGLGPSRQVAKDLHTDVLHIITWVMTLSGHLQQILEARGEGRAEGDPGLGEGDPGLGLWNRQREASWFLNSFGTRDRYSLARAIPKSSTEPCNISVTLAHISSFGPPGMRAAVEHLQASPLRLCGALCEASVRKIHPNGSVGARRLTLGCLVFTDQACKQQGTKAGEPFLEECSPLCGWGSKCDTSLTTQSWTVAESLRPVSGLHSPELLTASGVPGSGLRIARWAICGACPGERA